MPLDPGTISAVMLASLAGNSMAGISAPQLAQGVANGLSIYAESGLTVSTEDTGVVGAGTGIGVGLIIPTPTLLGSLTSTFPANGIAGTSAPMLINALALGFTQAFATALINTINPVVGVGVGIVTVIPSPSSSVAAFIAGFAAAGLTGISAAPLATAISSALDIALPSGIGVVVIAGSPSIYPSAGVGYGKFS